MLDTIFQIRQKHFISAQDMGDFVNALFDLFDPQENLCPIGQEPHQTKGGLPLLADK